MNMITDNFDPKFMEENSDIFVKPYWFEKTTEKPQYALLEDEMAEYVCEAVERESEGYYSLSIDYYMKTCLGLVMSDMFGNRFMVIADVIRNNEILNRNNKLGIAYFVNRMDEEKKVMEFFFSGTYVSKEYDKHQNGETSSEELPL